MIIYFIQTRVRMLYLYLKALFISLFKQKEIKCKSNKIAFVMLAANYNNLGDIAITKSQEAYLRKILPADYTIVVVPYDETFNVYYSMKRLVNENTIITLIGGGNSGSLYEFIEWPRRFILEKFKYCKIISFPQSVYYEESKLSNYYKNAFINRCKKCVNLTLIARERDSYEKYMDMGLENTNIMLIPDIVFSMEYNSESVSCEKSKDIALVFRDDIEKSLTMSEEHMIQEIAEEIAEEIGSKILYLDTCDVIISGNGYSELNDYLAILSSSKMVFTDRLHGMIMSYITGTKCVVFDNNNHKIKATVQTWFTNKPCVKYYNNIENLPKCYVLDSLLCRRNSFDDQFTKLKEAIING